MKTPLHRRPNQFAVADGTGASGGAQASQRVVGSCIRPSTRHAEVVRPELGHYRRINHRCP